MPMVYTTSILSSKKNIKQKSRKVSVMSQENLQIKENAAFASHDEPDIYSYMQLKSMAKDSDSDWNSSSDEEDDSGKK